MGFFKSRNWERMSDERLIQSYQDSGEMEILGELYFRYTHLVLGVALKYLKDEEAAKDAVMDIFEQLASSLDQYKINNFKNWLYSVTKNYCLMMLRNQRRMRIFNIEDQIGREVNHLLMDEEWAGLLPDGSEITSEDIQGAINQLSSHQQRCLELFFYENKRYKDISGMTGFSEGEVKSYIQNGKRNLRKILMSRSD